MPLQKTAGQSAALTTQLSVDRDSQSDTVVTATAPEFQIEINQTVIVKKIDSLIQAWCAGCGAEGQWVTADHAAIISNTDTRSIYRRIELGEVHFLESTDGPALVCLNSLFA